MAAAVVLDPRRHIAGLRDSKLLTPAQRERLYAEITDNARWAVGSVTPADVDRLNVYRASLDALRQAIAALEPRPAFALIDGFRVPDLVCRSAASPAAIDAARRSRQRPSTRR